MKIKGLILLLTFIGVCNAEDKLSLSIGVNTIHPLTDYKYDNNNDNELVALSYGSEKYGYFASTLINSYHTRSYAAGFYFSHRPFDSNLFITLRVGAIHGYEKDQIPCYPHPVCGFAAPSLGYNLNDQLSYEVMVFGEAVVQSVSYHF